MKKSTLLWLLVFVAAVIFASIEFGQIHKNNQTLKAIKQSKF